MQTHITRATRIFFGLLGISSIILEIAILVGGGSFNAANFFSFFTVISNILAASFLIFYGLSGKTSKTIQAFRGAITLYMLMTGIIFAILLAGLEGVRLTALPWNNLVLHYIMPVVVVLDWLITPPKQKLSVKAVLLWLALPVAYIIYTLIRGPLVAWYPYPFLNPANSSLLSVILTSLLIAVFVVVAAFGLRGYALLRARTTKGL